MEYHALFEALRARGHRSTEIMEAFIDADPSLGKASRDFTIPRLGATGRELRISRDGSLFRASIRDSTRSELAWETTAAMSLLDLYDTLRARGLHPVDVQNALVECDPNLLDSLRKQRERGR